MSDAILTFFVCLIVVRRCTMSASCRPPSALIHKPGWHRLYSAALASEAMGFWDGEGHWTRLVVPDHVRSDYARDDFVVVEGL